MKPEEKKISPETDAVTNQDLARLVVLQNSAHEPETAQEFAIFVTNQSHQLSPFFQSLCWHKNSLNMVEVMAVSGVSSIDSNAIIVRFMVKLIKAIIAMDGSEKSKIIYVELINDKDSIVALKELYTNNVSVAGDFKINKNWKPGTYMLRAYTNYMRNNNPDYFFKKEIPVWALKEEAISNQNPTIIENHNAAPKETTITRPDLNFYPEGGYLINGIQSKVAIKVKDDYYKEANITGVIKDSDHKTISAFKVFEFGLGALTFTPEANKTYYASIICNGKTENYELPKALPKGFSLNLLNHGNEIVLKAAATNKIGLKNAFIVAHHRGEVIFQKLIEKNTNKFTVKFNTENFNSGVTNITLFNNNGKPVCERLVFINNSENNVIVNMSNNNDVYKTREKVSLQLDLKDKKGNPLTGNLSLTVNDLQSIQKNYKDDHIKSYLLLNSDLRGKIENPGYFFEEGKESKRRYLLDLVMLTHGWSRFTWNDLLYSAPKTENKYATEKGLYISGQVQALKDRRSFIAAPTKLTVMKEGEVPFQELKQSDENGQFTYGPYVFFDSVPMLVEARVKAFKSDYSKNSDVHISIHKKKYKSPKVNRTNLLRKSKINKAVAAKFMEQALSGYKIDTAYFNSSQRLNEIIITAKKETLKEKRNKELSSLTDYGSPRRRLDMESIIGAKSLSISNLIQRLLPGVNIINDSISLRGGKPALLLDGFSAEYQEISHLSGSDIEFIDLLSGASASLVRNNANGVIAIYTKTGNGFIDNTKPEPGIINFKYPGFYTAREFYEPNYADSFYDSAKPDTRKTTLHWEPKIRIKENAKAEVTFFTNDTKTDYTIEIEGITDGGIPVYHFSTFEVE